MLSNAMLGRGVGMLALPNQSWWKAIFRGTGIRFCCSTTNRTASFITSRKSHEENTRRARL